MKTIHTRPPDAPEFLSLFEAVRVGLQSVPHRYAAVESFCGPGGMTLGLANAGFFTALSFDLNPAAVATHNSHSIGRSEVLDCREATGDALRTLAGLPADFDLPLFAGGPPCQGFSKQRRGAHLGDDRNDLVLEFYRLVSELRPRYFLFENVAIFGQKRGKQYLAAMRELLPGYSVDTAFVNSAEFGLAQTRQRFLALGSRSDQTAVRVPRRTHKAWTTVGDVIGDLPEPPLDFSDHPNFANHQRARVTELNIRRFSFVPEGGGWLDIPHELRLRCHQQVDTSSGGWPDVYGRLCWHGQCPTITGGFDSFTRGRFGHPRQHRPLTPREAARLQGFPDWITFTGTRGDIRSQIGNAVPPPLAFGLGVSILLGLLMSDGVDISVDSFVHQGLLSSSHTQAGLF